MNTKNIQDFLALAELSSSYAAAEKLYVSQSTLIRHIQSLEDEFGMPLFERTRTGFVLNEARRIFQVYAKKIELAEKQCYKMLHCEKDSDVIKMSAQTNVMDVMIEFKKRYPQYIFDYTKTGSMELRLREGIVDLAFLANVETGDKELVVLPYTSEEVAIVVHKENPLARKESITLDDLKEERLIRLCEDTLFEEVLEDIFSKDKDFIVDSVPAGDDALQMVHENLGVFIIHGSMRQLEDVGDLCVVKLDPPIHYDVSLCYRNDGHLPKAAERFIRFAVDWKVRERSKKAREARATRTAEDSEN
ncbi:MAG: LysR family transcriptional regulator [Clostridiales bacterium]|nr:LysR family transcriptional regulator [Clostridiales bacterium]